MAPGKRLQAAGQTISYGSNQAQTCPGITEINGSADIRHFSRFYLNIY